MIQLSLLLILELAIVLKFIITELQWCKLKFIGKNVLCICCWHKGCWGLAEKSQDNEEDPWFSKIAWLLWTIIQDVRKFFTLCFTGTFIWSYTFTAKMTYSLHDELFINITVKKPGCICRSNRMICFISWYSCIFA